MTILHTWVAPNTHWVAVLQSMTASEYYVVSQGRCVRVGEPGSRKASWLADDQGLALKMHLHSKHPSFTQVACLFGKLADANEHCRLSPSFCAPFLSPPISSIQGLSWSFLYDSISLIPLFSDALLAVHPFIPFIHSLINPQILLITYWVQTFW